MQAEKNKTERLVCGGKEVAFTACVQEMFQRLDERVYSRVDHENGSVALVSEEGATCVCVLAEICRVEYCVEGECGCEISEICVA